MDFQSLITKLVDIMQASKDHDMMGWGITPYVNKTVYRGIHLKYIQGGGGGGGGVSHRSVQKSYFRATKFQNIT